ncbi:hypothetical protein DDE82_003868 [Stemphylium lycopersici]|nr:hypothetical protein TW65_08474 [Stemphylium lycopersici]RAR05679.1 hypothetical protein DDE82_003868 [Stemphylium lycopersici]
MAMQLWKAPLHQSLPTQRPAMGLPNQPSEMRKLQRLTPLGQPGRPVLRRGPQRSTRDAITAPGHISILQPQQAVFTSVDEDDEHASDHEAAQSTFHDNSPVASNFPSPESNHGSDSLGLADQSTAGIQAIRTSHTPPSRSSAFVTSGSDSGIDSAMRSTRSPSANSASSTSRLRGGGRTSGHHIHNTRDSTHPPSPLHQMQRLNSPAQQASPGDPTKSSTSPSPYRPTLYLQGYFAQTPNGTGYRFLERLPHSSRQFSSDTTGASSNYSWYGSLPSDTRFPSSARSSQHEASHQLDGAGPSNLGLHSSHPGNGFMDLRPPSAAVSGLHGLSPLPSMPYTRIQNEPSSSPAAPSFFDQVSGGLVDAATAVICHLQSPLDAYAEHYQRELQAQHIRPAVPAHVNPSLSSAGGSQARRSSQSQDARPGNQAQFAPGSRPIASLQSQHGALRAQQQRSSEHLARSATYRSNVSTRSGQPTTSEHRPSENAPVMTHLNQGDAARHGRVQTQRAAYERLQNPAHAMHAGIVGGPDMFAFRHSMPQTTSPYGRSNRPRDHVPHHHSEMRPSSPFPMHQPRQASQSHGTHADSPVLPRLPPHQGSRPHVPTHTYRPAPGTLRLRPTRDNPLTALAFEQGSGTTSRHPHSPLIRTTAAATARTHRRIPPEQRDQENDGDRALMRREEASVHARYGEDEQQRSMMNETPPRIGRVERRMMEG